MTEFWVNGPVGPGFFMMFTYPWISTTGVDITQYREILGLSTGV